MVDETIKQKGRHFAHENAKFISSYETCFNVDSNSTEICFQGPMNNKPESIQIMVFPRTGDKPSSETMVAYVTDVYMRYSALKS